MSLSDTVRRKLRDLRYSLRRIQWVARRQAGDLEQFDAKLDTLSKLLLMRFASVFQHVQYETSFSDRLELRIPPAHADIDELQVLAYVDTSREKEIMVVIGNHFHAHFAAWSLDDALSPQQTESRAVNEAVGFIRDWLEDKIVLRVVHTDYGVVEASARNKHDEGRTLIVIPVWSEAGQQSGEHYHLSSGSISVIRQRRKPETRWTQEFLWSGPYRSDVAYQHGVSHGAVQVGVVALKNGKPHLLLHKRPQ